MTNKQLFTELQSILDMKKIPIVELYDNNKQLKNLFSYNNLRDIHNYEYLNWNNIKQDLHKHEEIWNHNIESCIGTDIIHVIKKKDYYINTVPKKSVVNGFQIVDCNMLKHVVQQYDTIEQRKNNNNLVYHLYNLHYENPMIYNELDGIIDDGF
jgi:hypothetical protein